MRTIRIDDTSDFALLYQGFLVGGNASSANKTIQTVRREAKILDKLDDLSQPVTPEERYPTGDVVRELVAAPALLQLTTEEHELLKKYFEAVPWTTTASRQAVRLADLIDNAATE